MFPAPIAAWVERLHGRELLVRTLDGGTLVVRDEDEHTSLESIRASIEERVAEIDSSPPT